MKYEKRNKAIISALIGLILAGLVFKEFFMEDGILFMPIIWLIFYAYASMYGKIICFMRENVFSGGGCLAVLLGWIVVPFFGIAIIFTTVPELVAYIFPETWKSNVEFIIAAIMVFVVIIYDVYKIKKEYDFYKEIKKDDASSGDEV